MLLILGASAALGLWVLINRKPRPPETCEEWRDRQW
jgi:hypothetical protein